MLFARGSLRLSFVLMCERTQSGMLVSLLRVCALYSTLIMSAVLEAPPVLHFSTAFRGALSVLSASHFLTSEGCACEPKRRQRPLAIHVCCLVIWVSVNRSEASTLTHSKHLSLHSDIGEKQVAALIQTEEVHRSSVLSHKSNI